MTLRAIKEKDHCYSEFLKGTSKTTVVAAEVPEFGYLNVELARLRVGMSDFIVRASTAGGPKPEGDAKIVSIRGGRSLIKYESCKKLCEMFGKEFASLNDEVLKWDRLDIEHLADMIYGKVKFFASNPSVERLQFSTEALSTVKK
jgi:hypothetical protein